MPKDGGTVVKSGHQDDGETHEPAPGMGMGKFLPENGQGHRDKNADEDK